MSAAGHEDLVTEIFNEQDPYIDSDATFGVRDSLVISFDREPTAGEQARLTDLQVPFTMADFDFRLKAQQDEEVVSKQP